MAKHFDKASDRLTCPYCTWFHEPYQGQTCVERFGIDSLSTACDEYKSQIPKGTLIVKDIYQGNSRTGPPQFATLLEVDTNSTTMVAVPLASALLEKGSNKTWVPIKSTIPDPRHKPFPVLCSMRRAHAGKLDISMFRDGKPGSTIRRQTLTLSFVPLWFDFKDNSWSLLNPFKLNEPI